MTTLESGWQLDGQGPAAYERFLVPAFFAPCAELLLDAAGAAAGERVLDVACGTGVVARTALGRGCVVTGTDVNQAMIETARSLGDGIEWRLADAAALPFADAAYDLVCCQQGLQFIADPAGGMRELHRVLRPGGRVAVAVWRSIEHNPAFPGIVAALDRGLGTAGGDVLRSPFAGPDQAGLRRLAEDAGFGGVRMEIGTFATRFPSAEEFLRREAVSSPLAGLVGALEPAALRELVEDVSRSLEAYADDDGVLLPMQTWLLTARA